MVTDACDFEGKFPGLTRHIATIDSFFKWPFLREWLLLFNACSCKYEAVEYKLTKHGPGGNMVFLAIGGIKEMFLATKYDYQLNIMRRKGFIRLALRTGTRVVPMFMFGETHQFVPATLTPYSLSALFKKFLETTWGVPLPFIRGRLTGLVPLRKPINHVVGKPIFFDKKQLGIELGSDDEAQMVDYCHAKYLEALRNLYDEHKAKYGDSDRKLIFS